MVDLPALDTIAVPAARADKIYSQTLLGELESFRGLKMLLGAADFSKAGDRNAGLAASERTAARSGPHDPGSLDARGISTIIL